MVAFVDQRGVRDAGRTIRCLKSRLLSSSPRPSGTPWWKWTHQHPLNNPPLRSTRAAKSSHVEVSSALILRSDMATD